MPVPSSTSVRVVESQASPIFSAAFQAVAALDV